LKGDANKEMQIGSKTIEDDKLDRMVEIAIQVAIEAIREDRRKSGLDPVWEPTKEWMLDKIHYYTELFKSI
jgi:hypothetical protein